MTSRKDKLRVLIVEDEFLLADEIEYALRQLGHDVVGIAATSQQALALAEKTRPDLAFVDIQLRDGPTGVAVARRIADMIGTRCVFVSSSLERIPEDYAGAVGHIGKPYSEGGLTSAIAYIGDAIDGPGPRRAKPSSLVLSPRFALKWAA